MTFDSPEVRIGAAAALGLLLVTPARAPTMPPTAVAVPAVVHLGPDDSALSAGKLPDTFPDDWRRPPCPKAKSIVRVREACFAVLAEKPPCELGYEDAGMCLMPIAKMQRTPSTIGR